MDIPRGFRVLRTCNPRNAVFTYSGGVLTIYSTAKLTEDGIGLLLSYAKTDSLAVNYKDIDVTIENNEVVSAKQDLIMNGSVLSMKIGDKTFTELCKFFPRIFNPLSVSTVCIISETEGGYVYIDGVFHSYHEDFMYSYNFVTTDDFNTERIIKNLDLLIAGILIRRGNYVKSAFLPEATALIPKLKRLGMLDEFLFNMSKYVDTFKAITFDKSLETASVLYIPEHLRVGLHKCGFIFNMPVVQAVGGFSSSALNNLIDKLMHELPYCSIIPASSVDIERNLTKVNSLLEEAENLLSGISNGDYIFKNSSVRRLVGLIDTYINLKGRLVSALSN